MTKSDHFSLMLRELAGEPPFMPAAIPGRVVRASLDSSGDPGLEILLARVQHENAWRQTLAETGASPSEE